MGQEREQRKQQRVRNYYSNCLVVVVIIVRGRAIKPLLVSLFVFLSFSGTHRDHSELLVVSFFFVSRSPKHAKRKSCFFELKIFEIFIIEIQRG
jgi:hypothetical protein